MWGNLILMSRWNPLSGRTSNGQDFDFFFFLWNIKAATNEQDNLQLLAISWLEMGERIILSGFYCVKVGLIKFKALRKKKKLHKCNSFNCKQMIALVFFFFFLLQAKENATCSFFVEKHSICLYPKVVNN